MGVVVVGRAGILGAVGSAALAGGDGIVTAVAALVAAFSEM